MIEPKRCPHCKEYKDVSQFYWEQRKDRKPGYSSWCKTCDNLGKKSEKAKALRRLNRPKATESEILRKRIRYMVSTLYKSGSSYSDPIDQLDWEYWYSKQNGNCALCHNHIPRGCRGVDLVVPKPFPKIIGKDDIRLVHRSCHRSAILLKIHNNQYGGDNENRSCRVCSQRKPLSDFKFQSHSTKGVYRSFVCTPCFPAWNLSRSKKRRAAKAKVINTLTHEEWLTIVELYRGRCAYCDGVPKGRITMDHVIPISKMGPHAKENVVPACKPCNCTKGDRSVGYLIKRLIEKGVLQATY